MVHGWQNMADLVETGSVSLKAGATAEIIGAVRVWREGLEWRIKGHPKDGGSPGGSRLGIPSRRLSPACEVHASTIRPTTNATDGGLAPTAGDKDLYAKRVEGLQRTGLGCTPPSPALVAVSRRGTGNKILRPWQMGYFPSPSDLSHRMLINKGFTTSPVRDQLTWKPQII